MRRTSPANDCRQIVASGDQIPHPQSDKVMRLHAQTAMIENGFVHLPEEPSWLALYLAELTAFPNARHDDQVDLTAQMLDWFKGAVREPGGFYVLQNARRRASRSADG